MGARRSPAEPTRNTGPVRASGPRVEPASPDGRTGLDPGPGAARRDRSSTGRSDGPGDRKSTDGLHAGRRIGRVAASARSRAQWSAGLADTAERHVNNSLLPSIVEMSTSRRPAATAGGFRARVRATIVSFLPGPGLVLPRGTARAGRAVRSDPELVAGHDPVRGADRSGRARPAPLRRPRSPRARAALGGRLRAGAVRLAADRAAGRRAARRGGVPAVRRRRAQLLPQERFDPGRRWSADDAAGPGGDAQHRRQRDVDGERLAVGRRGRVRDPRAGAGVPAALPRPLATRSVAARGGGDRRSAGPRPRRRRPTPCSRCWP